MKKDNGNKRFPAVKTSEYCTVGHPDRTCDYIASYILDRYLEDDPLARVALEVQLKDTYCTVSGEVSSKTTFSENDIADFVRRAIVNVGYTHGYQRGFGSDKCISAESVHTVCHIGEQSPEISIGVSYSLKSKCGWGDQGIFFGYAVNSPETNYMPKDHYLARNLGDSLYDDRIGGIDIKTQISMEGDEVTDCVVAIPLLHEEGTERVSEYVRKFLGECNCPITINGTGWYVRHGSIGDCGTTGRKLVVDFYGGNCRIGGGSPWGKDPTKADVTLNMYARHLAVKALKKFGEDEVTCAISCCIGKSTISISYINGRGEVMSVEQESRDPMEIIDLLDLRSPNYADKCAYGLFAYMPSPDDKHKPTATGEHKTRRLQSLLTKTTYDYLKRSAIEQGVSVNERLNTIINEAANKEAKW